MVRRKKRSAGKFVAFSYISGRRLGRFNSLAGVFKKFPKERKAFNTVKRFNRRTGLRINTIRQIITAKRMKNIKIRWR